MLSFPINIIEIFFKNTEIHKLLRAPQLNILYKKKYKSDIRNIFWRKVYHLTAKKYESRQWMAQIQHLNLYSVTTQRSLSELWDRFSLRSYTFSLFLTNLSCFLPLFCKKRARSLMLLGQNIVHELENKEGLSSPGTWTREQLVQKWLWHFNL